MRSHGRLLLRCSPALSALLFACGCGILPGTFGLSNEPTPSPTKTGQQHPLVAPAPSANSVAPVTGPGPAPVLPLNLAGPESPQDLISMQAQSLNAAADDRKLMAARMMQLEAALQDKEKAIAEAIDDVTRTGEDLAKMRAESRHVKQEKAELQGKVEKLEKEVIELRKQIIKMMEKEQPPEGPPMEPALHREP
jgi:hypothetical protein